MLIGKQGKKVAQVQHQELMMIIASHFIELFLDQNFLQFLDENLYVPCPYI